MPRWMILTYSPTHIYKRWSCPWMGSLHLNKIEYTVHKDVFIQVETLYDIPCCAREIMDLIPVRGQDGKISDT
jgi:hypothetical protein